MADPLEDVLHLVAEGRITAAEAAPILDALSAADRARGDEANGGTARETASRSGSSLRIEVTESGRRVVNLRIPLPLGRFALDRIPGLAGTNVDLVRQAIAEGRVGTLLDLDDEDGDGVRIAIE
jgi:hypothetical protein